MQLEATGKPIKYRLKTGEEVTLRPGVPIELPDLAASRLLMKAPDKVRMVKVQGIGKLTIETAAGHARPVFWEAVNGQILGPGLPEFLARDGGTFWIVTSFNGQAWWINSDRLRSQKAFEEQVEVREVEPIRF